ncbi:MAG: sugar ABC transporter substrate-binding protein [Chloroflexi bacterium]|nr:MAG: sugar ABC transporter substrate-binding protein [Chloroflexota bacterium]
MKLFDRKHRSFSTVFGVGLLMLLLVACGNSGTTSTTTTSAPTNGKGCTKVGILLPETASSARWDSKDKPLLTQKIKAVLPSGATVDYNNAGGDSNVQQSQAQADLTKGDCILVIAPHDGAAAATIVASANAKSVPVIAYDRLIQSKDLAYYVSFDNVKVGQLQGQYIVDHYKNFVSPGKNHLVMIDGAQTDNNALLFSQGAHSALDPLISSGALKKVYEQFTPDWNNDTARTEMDGALTANQNNVQIAYVANDGMANSVIASLKAKKLNGKVLVTGQDATVAGIQNILTGDQAMTVYKAIDKETQATADLVKAIYNGSGASSLTNGTVKTADGTSIKSVLETPVAVDKTNIQSTVIADGFVTKADICQGLPAGTGGIC